MKGWHTHLNYGHVFVETTPFTINCIPDSLKSISIPVKFKCSEAGTYRLFPEGASSFTNAVKIELEDVTAGEKTNITDLSELTFSYPGGSVVKEYILHFNLNASGIEDNENPKPNRMKQMLMLKLPIPVVA
ncbi:MAG: hypothetical protein MZU79_02275 [Anaerotruncus sp.]|nr:hypothetical protein [Anaerotruncus sp.]